MSRKAKNATSLNLLKALALSGAVMLTSPLAFQPTQANASECLLDTNNNDTPDLGDGRKGLMPPDLPTLQLAVQMPMLPAL